MEYATVGIGVNTVAPGVVYTPLHRNTPKDLGRFLHAREPAGQGSKMSKEQVMTTLMQHTAHEKRAMSSRVEAVGRVLARYGLVVVVAWIGLMKFTAYEAEGIRPFVANSPLMSWVYGLMSVRGFSAVLGVVEVAIALLIAARPFSPRASALGSALAVGMFLTTLSFLSHDAGRLGAESRRLPRPVGAPGAVPHQGPGPARDFALVARRGLEGGRAKGMRTMGVSMPLHSHAFATEPENAKLLRR